MTVKFQPENFRQILHSGYSALRGLEVSKALSGVTLNHVIKGHIDSLKRDSLRASFLVDDRGESLGDRISQWDRIDEIEKMFKDAVKALEAAGDSTESLNALGITSTKGDYLSSSGTSSKL
jgi:hypothetical protein